MAWHLRYTAFTTAQTNPVSLYYWRGWGPKELKAKRWLVAGFFIPPTIDPNHRTVLLRTLYHHLWQGYLQLQTPSVLFKVQSLVQQLVASQAPIPILLTLVWIEKQAEGLVLYGASNAILPMVVVRGEQRIPLPNSIQGVSGWLEPGDTIWLTAEPITVDLPAHRWHEWGDFHHHAGGFGITVEKPAWWRTVMKAPAKPALVALSHSAAPVVIPKPILKKRRVALALAVLFFALLALSMWIGAYKRKALSQSAVEQQLVDDITYRLNQAQALKTLNPTRAKTLLEEAQTTLESYTQEPLPNSQLTELKHSLTQAYAEVAGQYLVDQPEVFFDLNLIKDGFKPQQLSLAEQDLVLLDDTSQTLVRLDLSTKAGSILAGPELVPRRVKLASIPAWVFLTGTDVVHIIDKQTQEQVSSFRLSKISMDKLIGYSNNAYVLDRDHNQIWRFRGTQTGLAKPEPFFTADEELSGVADMAIDGAVWLLYNDGGVAKFTSGIKDAYYPEVELDEPFTAPSTLFTSDIDEHLYVWEKDTARIVSISKAAEFTAVYRWPGLNSIDDFVVSEAAGKILALKDGVLYGINLK